MTAPKLAPELELHVPHIGWLRHEAGDEVALYLNEGWFEYREQAFAWLYLREGDTVLDAGAHFGLYSALAGRAEAGRVVAVEPNPAVLPYLRANIVRHEPRAVTIVEAALSDRDGSARFSPGASGKAAYSSLFPEQESASAFPVETMTLDTLCRRHGIERIDLAKIDVEGAELGVLAGANEALAANRIACLLIECTELNLRRAGHDTQALFAALASAGLGVYAFDEHAFALTPRRPDGPIWYDNLIATRDAGTVNARLHHAHHSRARLAREIVARGRAAAALKKRAEEAGDAVRRLDQTLALLDEAYRRGGEANWRADSANQRADSAWKQLEEAWRNLAEARVCAEQLRLLLATRYARLGLRLGFLHDPRRP